MNKDTLTISATCKGLLHTAIIAVLGTGFLGAAAPLAAQLLPNPALPTNLVQTAQDALSSSLNGVSLPSDSINNVNIMDSSSIIPSTQLPINGDPLSIVPMDLSTVDSPVIPDIVENVINLVESPSIEEIFNPPLISNIGDTIVNTLTEQRTLDCQGTETRSTFNASELQNLVSGNPSYSWTTTCAGATISSPQSSEAVLNLTLPGFGQSQDCSISVTADNGTQSYTRTVQVTAKECDLNCQPYEVDLCGVCKGNNACLDCAGRPSDSGICAVCTSNAQCRSCTEVNLQDIIVQLDAKALNGSKAIQKALRTIKRADVKRRARASLRNASRFYAHSATVVRTLKPRSLSCNHYVGCSHQTSDSTLREYQQTVAKLKKAAQRSVQFLRTERSKKSLKAAKQLRKSIKAAAYDVSDIAGKYPTATFSCD